MSESVRPIIRQPNRRVVLRALLCLMILVLTGCFGSEAMHYDIQQYNKEVLSSEKEMLLYNIAALREGQSPHFTMVSNINASRTFTATASFTFTNLWNKVFLATKANNFQKGSNTYAATATSGVTESPTITYLPIQGQDFASRFESPITPDKLNIFIEDINLNPATKKHLEWLMLLIAQDVEILHGDWRTKFSRKTEFSDYDNYRSGRWTLKSDIKPSGEVCPDGFEDPINKENDYDLFWNCVSHIIKLFNVVSEIDANHVIVPSVVAKEPTPTEVLSAQQQGLSWLRIPNATKTDSTTKTDNVEYKLANAVKIRGFSDYTPKFKEAAETKEQKDQTNPERRLEFSYGDRIADYLWPVPYDSIYVEFRRDKVTDKQAEHECFDDLPTEAEMEGLSTRSEMEGLSTRAKFDFLLQALREQLATKGNTPELLKRKEQLQQDYDLIQNDVVCGFIKTGNLGQIMQTLGKMACTDDQGSTKGTCLPKSVFGIGSTVPSWATDWAPYSKFPVPVYPKKWIWVPAHDPHDPDPAQSKLAERDEFVFYTLYKLYEMSLVDTSKLVTPPPSITIPKP